MKHYIDLSKTKRLKLVTMLKELFSEYHYITLSNKGMVKFKTSWWSFKSHTSHILELCIDEIPRRIIQYRAKSSDYVSVYNTLSETIIRLKDRIDIVDFLWNQFLKIKYPLIINNASKNTLPSSRLLTLSIEYDIPGSYRRAVNRNTAIVRQMRKEYFLVDNTFKVTIPEWLRRLLFFKTGNKAFCH